MDLQELEVLFWKRKIIEVEVSIVTALFEVMNCSFIYREKIIFCSAERFYCTYAILEIDKLRKSEKARRLRVKSWALTIYSMLQSFTQKIFAEKFKCLWCSNELLMTNGSRNIEALRFNRYTGHPAGNKNSLLAEIWLLDVNHFWNVSNRVNRFREHSTRLISGAKFISRQCRFPWLPTKNIGTFKRYFILVR